MRGAKIVLVLLLAVPLVLGGLAAWQFLRDPLAALPKAEDALVAANDTARREGRQIHHVTMTDPRLGAIRFTVSLPDPLPDTPLPIVMVLGGLATGAENIRYISEPGDNVVVGYDWPVPPKLPEGWAIVPAAPELYDRIMTVPGQVATALRWLADQPWGDGDRISLLGFSLGALAAPAVQHVAAAENGLDIGWTVLAYGGAPIADLLASHPHIRPQWARPVLRTAGAVLLRPVDPLEHLPYLNGRFLLLGGVQDRLIPEPLAARLRHATPEPKEIVLFAGDHMGVGPNQLALLDQIVRVSRRWLLESGAVNPPGT